MPTELTIHPRVAQFVVQVVARALALYAIVQGVGIVVGGARRWSGRSYDLALYLPGAPPSLGATLAVAGVIALVGSLAGRRTPVVVGMWVAGVWSIFLAASFGVASWRDALASTTGLWMYMVMGVTQLTMAVAYSRSKAISP